MTEEEKYGMERLAEYLDMRITETEGKKASKGGNRE